jgi:two-component system, sensor histidine kinase and response regulator
MDGGTEDRQSEFDDNVLAPRILIVEDNPVNRRVALRLLHHLGYRADTAENGAEAVEAVATGDYAAVLMDCDMPVVDGFEATRRIRATERPGPRLPILAVTAATRPGDREACIAAGMDDYLAKPIRASDLALALDRLIPQPDV